LRKQKKSRNKFKDWGHGVECDLSNEEREKKEPSFMAIIKP
jgi:hypothetical protein